MTMFKTMRTLMAEAGPFEIGLLACLGVIAIAGLFPV
jgi:hypothetical protein